jgi:hypothetical protein
MQFLGVAMIATATAILVAAWSGPMQEEFFLRIAGGVAAVVTGLVGGAVYKRGARSVARSAVALTSVDPRPPVVYLRSFQDDRVTDQGFVAHQFYSFLAAVNSEEQDLAAVMNEIGPFIAIGCPGENLPQAGAARMYLRDDEWRARVSELIAKAGLVAIRAGGTEGLWWEVAAAATTVRPERLIFLLPFTAPQYEAFRGRASAYLPSRLPDYRPVHKRLRNIGTVRGFLYFEPNWTAHYRELKPLKIGNYRPMRRLFKFALEPVYSQLGIPWTRPGRWDVFGVILGPFVAVIAILVLLGGLVKILQLLGILDRG